MSPELGACWTGLAVPGRDLDLLSSVGAAEREDEASCLGVSASDSFCWSAGRAALRRCSISRRRASSVLSSSVVLVMLYFLGQ